MVQLVNTSACHAEDRGFKSRQGCQYVSSERGTTQSVDARAVRAKSDAGARFFSTERHRTRRNGLGMSQTIVRVYTLDGTKRLEVPDQPSARIPDGPGPRTVKSVFDSANSKVRLLTVLVQYQSFFIRGMMPSGDGCGLENRG